MNVNLLAPAGLIAAISLGVVLLLHIRRHTPPPRSFPSLAFWSRSDPAELERQRIRRPPITLPLILQLLLALLVTLALARPTVSGAFSGLGGRTAPQHNIVLVDGSTSMFARDTDAQRNRYEEARQDALTILGDWQAGDVSTVVLLGTIDVTRSASNREQVDELHDWLQNAPPPGGIADLAKTLQTVRNLGLPDRDNRITLLTDAALQADPEIVATVPMPIKVRVVGDGTTDNVAITGIDAQAIADTVNQFAITFAITNFSASDADIPWIVTADGSEIAANTAFLRASETTRITVNLPSATAEARAQLEFSDALYADNQALLPIGKGRLGQLKILLVSDAPSAVLRALQVLPSATVDLQPANLPGVRDVARAYDIVVFEGTAPPIDQMPEKPLLFIQPGNVPDLFNVAGVLIAPSVAAVDAASPLLDGIDLSGVTFGDVPVYGVPADSAVAVTGSDAVANAPLVWSGAIADQPYVAFAFDITSSNIGQRVAFPILIASVASFLATSPIPLSIPTGDPIELAAPPDTAEITVTLPNQEQFELPAPTDAAVAPVFSETGLSGAYAVTFLRSDGSSAGEGMFAVNAGHPRESNLLPNPDLANALSDTGNASRSETGASDSGSELWLILAAVVLVLMLLEWLVTSDALRRRSPHWQGETT